MSETKKKNPWTIVLSIVKYAITLAIGYLSGDSDVINELF